MFSLPIFNVLWGLPKLSVTRNLSLHHTLNSSCSANKISASTRWSNLSSVLGTRVASRERKHISRIIATIRGSKTSRARKAWGWGWTHSWMHISRSYWIRSEGNILWSSRMASYWAIFGESSWGASLQEMCLLQLMYRPPGEAWVWNILVAGPILDTWI